LTKKYHFEDFTPGRVWEIDGPTIGKDEIVEFAHRFDPQYFHVDERAAEDSPYGGLIASGWQTVGICMRLICDAYLLQAASLGSPGVNEVRWTKPVRPGDRLSFVSECVERRESRSRPTIGIVTTRSALMNQDGLPVLTMKTVFMVEKRPR